MFRNCRDAKQMWSTARKVLGMEREKGPTAVVNEKGEITSNPQELADEFNKFFINKVKDLRESAKKKAKESLEDPMRYLREMLDKKGVPEVSQLVKITKRDLRLIMKSVKPGKSCGDDTIDGYSLKLAYPLIEDSLLHLVNLSIQARIFADKWKPLTIFPHHKKESRLLLKNYQPVCNLVEVGKIVERVVAKQMLQHMDRNNLLDPNLHGGLGDLSPATAHIQIQEHLLEAVANRMLSGILMIDQTAAYDLLDHQLIKDKMRAYNLGDSFIEWIDSYLSGRKQRTRVQARASNQAPVGDCGAPQGSILAGLLHIVSSNDCPSANKEGTSVLFVDDQTDLITARKTLREQHRGRLIPPADGSRRIGW